MPRPEESSAAQLWLALYIDIHPPFIPPENEQHVSYQTVRTIHPEPNSMAAEDDDPPLNRRNPTVAFAAEQHVVTLQGV